MADVIGSSLFGGAAGWATEAGIVVAAGRTSASLRSDAGVTFVVGRWLSVLEVSSTDCSYLIFA